MPSNYLQEHVLSEGMDVSSLPNRDLRKHIIKLYRDFYMDGTVSSINEYEHKDALDTLENELTKRLELIDEYIEKEREYELILSEDRQNIKHKKKGRYS